jgi:hypothetical protein
MLVIHVYSAKNQMNRYDRQAKTKKSECERSTCAHIRFLDEAQNCINQCISPACYREIYGDSPLEDGEIDSSRSRAFTACLRKELRNIVRL